MEHRIEWAGHQLTAWTTHVDAGWTWVYTIDDGAMVEGDPQANLPEAMVLDEGLGQARRALSLGPSP